MGTEKELVATCVIYIDIGKDETAYEAEKRLRNILNATGLEWDIYGLEKREKIR